MEYSGAIGKNINNIPIENIYVGMRILKRKAYITNEYKSRICNLDIYRVKLISIRAQYYNQLVVEDENFPGYLKIIEHKFKNQEISIFTDHESQMYWFIEND